MFQGKTEGCDLCPNLEKGKKNPSLHAILEIWKTPSLPDRFPLGRLKDGAVNFCKERLFLPGADIHEEPHWLPTVPGVSHIHLNFTD